MKSVKRFLSIQFIITVLVLSISTVYFSVPAKAGVLDDFIGDINGLLRLVGINEDVTIEDLRKTFIDQMNSNQGIIFKPVVNQITELDRKAIATIINYVRGNNNANKDNLTQQDYNDIAEYIVNNVSTDNSNNSVTYNDNSKAIFNLYAQEMLNETPMYTGYSLDLRYYDNGYRTSFIQNEIIPNQDSYLYFILNWNGNGPKSRAIKVDKTKFSLVSNSRTNPYSVINLYNSLTFQGDIKTDGTKIFDIATDGTYQESSSTNDIVTPNLRVMNENYSYRAGDYDVYFSNNGVNYMNNSTLVSYGKVYSYQIFGNYTMFTQSERGEAPYYIDNSVYSNWQNSTGDYTVNNTNSNHTSYGDITSYINSFNNENGSNPSPDDIEKFINNNNNTIINGGGSGGSGGSGTNGSINNTNNNNPVFNNNPNININFGFPTLSDNTVSGNGSNGSGGSGGIWDWLGGIGKTLGNLVKGLGELISNLFEGIVQAVTTILESVPNILTPLVEYIFGGLPEELQALITLGVTCIIMVAVIKAIKG